MVFQPTVDSFPFNDTRTKNVLFASLSAGSTALATILQQPLLIFISMLCFLLFKENPSLQIQFLEKHNAVLIKRLEDVISPLTEELSRQKSLIKKPLAEGDKGRQIIVIDGNNLFLSAKEEGLRIDYEKLIAEISKNSAQLVSVLYITSVDSTKPQEIRFLQYLTRIGCQVITEEVSNEGNFKKGNLDPEIMIQIIRASEVVDTIALLSGDSDFKPFVQYVKEKGCRVEVYGFEIQTSNKLRNVSDKYVDLKSLEVFRNKEINHQPDTDNGSCPPKPILRSKNNG